MPVYALATAGRRLMAAVGFAKSPVREKNRRRLGSLQAGCKREIDSEAWGMVKWEEWARSVTGLGSRRHGTGRRCYGRGIDPGPIYEAGWGGEAAGRR
jgi:hypothetical protein